MESNKVQWDIWKGEVQNLLIFVSCVRTSIGTKSANRILKAGLFSASVTAFIIESYKGLQRDPNNDIVNLLSHITIQLGNPLNTTSTIPFQTSLLLSIFTPSPSIIQINIFWFVSLILSLMTVVVGIVSLQWL